MTRTTRPDDIPVRYGSRYGSSDPAATRSDHACPVCKATLTSPRARYCSDACKQRAYRLRQAPDTTLDLDALTADLRSRRALVARTVYECPACETRFLGEQRCPDCHTFCRRLGLGGPCPHCDDPVTLAELLGLEEVQR
jgi:ssDNA-binding Zn-finger/Zn-ribbon topoisomerase 1